METDGSGKEPEADSTKNLVYLRRRKRARSNISDLQSMAEGGGGGSVEGGGELWINRKWRMELLVNHHARFCLRFMQSLPTAYEDYDTQRMTFLHFAITSLDILNCINKLGEEERSKIINWIYGYQIVGTPIERCGFLGSSTFLLKNHSSLELPTHLFSGHVTMTYAALVSLLTLGDDLSNFDRTPILTALTALQNPDGSFKASQGCEESDMRFVYCVVCICQILKDFSSINVPKLVDFIKKSFTYEGCFSSGHGAEGHAAYTFCAVASLVMMNKLHEALSSKQIQRLKKWCLWRQENGFTGRPNKSEDTCYSYWVGGTLALLGGLCYIDSDENINFLLGNQNPLSGGIGKYGNDHVDPLHTFLGLAALSLASYQGLNAVNAQLTMSENAVDHLKKLQINWK